MLDLGYVLRTITRVLRNIVVLRSSLDFFIKKKKGEKKRTILVATDARTHAHCASYTNAHTHTLHRTPHNINDRYPLFQKYYCATHFGGTTRRAVYVHISHTGCAVTTKETPDGARTLVKQIDRLCDHEGKKKKKNDTLQF